MPKCNKCNCEENFWEIIDTTFLDGDQQELLVFLECPECGEQLERKYRIVPRILTTLKDGKHVWIEAK